MTYLEHQDKERQDRQYDRSRTERRRGNRARATELSIRSSMNRAEEDTYLNMKIALWGKF